MPDLDLLISETLFVFSFVISLITWAISRRWFLALIVFSVLGNLSFLVSVDSRMFHLYHIIWLKYFSIFLWPLINIFLIIKYRKK